MADDKINSMKTSKNMDLIIGMVIENMVMEVMFMMEDGKKLL